MLLNKIKYSRQIFTEIQLLLDLSNLVNREARKMKCKSYITTEQTVFYKTCHEIFFDHIFESILTYHGVLKRIFLNQV